MDNTLILTQLSTSDFQRLLRVELEEFFQKNQITKATNAEDEIGGINLAIEITGLAKPTIYGKVSGRTIPHFKREKQLYFSRKELTEWLKSGKRKTQSEVALEAENFSAKTSR